MAAITVVYGVKDGKGKISNFQMNVPNSTALADVIDFATGMIPLVLALITGGLTHIGIAFDISDILSAGDDTAAATSDVEEGARFQFITNGGYDTALRLPTFDEAKIVAGTRLVNQADAAVIAFNLAMLTGIGGVVPTDTRGDDITGIAFEREDFQKSRA